MNPLEKATLALRFQLDKLQTLIESQSKKKTARARIGSIRQDSTSTELRKGRIGKKVRRRKVRSRR